jgi:nicotinamide mononucleotide transporter
VRRVAYAEASRMNVVEIAANAFNAASIVLAGRNSVHVWWTTIVGCVLFSYVFYNARLYADVTLQGFFIVASGFGWWRWLRGHQGSTLPVRHASAVLILAAVAFAALVAVGYGWLLHRYTDAYAPFVDSIILAFSVVGQLLMIDRRVENWWFWLLVNTVAVPLYASRGLYLTAVLYTGFWINAIVALGKWRALARDEGSGRVAGAAEERSVLSS